MYATVFVIIRNPESAHFGTGLQIYGCRNGPALFLAFGGWNLYICPQPMIGYQLTA
jgi:hypothetical protein